MSYPDSVRYLYSLGNELKVGAKWGLERMQALLAALDNPEREQKFVHVAGTNGKGSTCAALASVLNHSGLRTGLYTSPHLIEPTERIQISGTNVSERDFGQAFERVHAASERLVENGAIDAHPSYFETVTAMAFLLFRDHGAEISVIETGLGGRLDATNVITPVLTVITQIAFDHEAFLGNTIEAIAGEKAGILKPGVPAVLSRQVGPAAKVLLKRAQELGCPVHSTSDVQPSGVTATAEGSGLTLDGIRYDFALPGRHQIENALTALIACRELLVPEPSILAGFREVRWPGRLERMARNPDFILDGAHNPAGAQALSSYIREFYAKRPVWIVYGAMRDKAIDEVTELLFPLADHLIITMPDFPRALRPEAILEVRTHPNASILPTVPEAICYARTAPPDAVVFFTGSLYLVGEVRRLLLP